MSMVYALLMFISIVFIPRLDQAVFPSVDLPYLAVMASCGDADPDNIEMQVTKVIENSLSSVENLNRIRSYSTSGRAFVLLEFNYGTDIDKSESDVSSLISMVNRNLPSWVTSVSTLKINSIVSSFPFMSLTVDGPYSIEELKSIANTTIEPMISRIEGVGDVQVSGGGETQFHIDVDPNKLSSYNLTLAQVVAALSASNNMGTGGELTSGEYDYNVVTDNRFTSMEDMMNTKISSIGSRVVYVKDVANVVRGTKKGGRETYMDGNRTVSVSIYEANDASVSTVAKRVRAEILNIQKSLPTDVSINIRRDNSKNISAIINETYSSLFWGVILAAIVIFVFLVDLKSTIIIALSMPLSVLFTMLLMAIFDISVNMISMSGLILGIGMIVDASIVILENITNFRKEGETAPAAAILGSKNMFTAIVASTLTTICVFLPVIIYMNDLEMIGQMMKDLVFTICFSLACSLFIAITLVPALAGSILKIQTTTQRPYKGFLKAFDSTVNRIELILEEGYANILTFFLAYKRFLLLPLFLLLSFSFSLFGHLGRTMVPRSSSGDTLTLSLTLAEGTNSEITKKYVFDMQQKVMDTLPKESYLSIMAEINSNEGTLTINLPDLSVQEKHYSAGNLRNMLMPYLKSDANATWTYSSGQSFGSQSLIDIEVYSDNIDQMIELSNNLVSVLQENIPILTNIKSSLTGGAPRVNVVVNKNMADLFGVTPSALSSVLLTAITGSKATDISTMSNTETYDVVVKLSDEFMNDMTSLNSLLIPTNSGNVRLDSIATLELSTSPSMITREDKKRINHVTADAIEGYSSSDVTAMVESVIREKIAVPQGASVNLAGDSREFAKYVPVLIMVVVLALILVFAVMAAQFESLINPFIIFATIPLLIIGVVLIHFICDADFSVMSIIGVVALIGVVVNNGIVLVDAISREIRDYRTPVLEACVKCARRRLRPILMTTLTTVVGMIPMAFFPGEGAQQMQPIALTFVGGLITGAFLTLFLSPVLYSIFNKRRDKKIDDPNSRENQLRAFSGRLS